jgi:hypothetical protein
MVARQKTGSGTWLFSFVSSKVFWDVSSQHSCNTTRLRARIQKNTPNFLAWATKAALGDRLCYSVELRRTT